MKFQPDEWNRVWTTDADTARRFFGAPKDYPVEEVADSKPDKFGRRQFRVWAPK
jgi:hypothetical protein